MDVDGDGLGHYFTAHHPFFSQITLTNPGGFLPHQTTFESCHSGTDLSNLLGEHNVIITTGEQSHYYENKTQVVVNCMYT